MVVDMSQLLSSPSSACTWDAFTWQTWTWTVQQGILTWCQVGCNSQLSWRLLHLQHVHVLKEGRYQRWCPGPSQCPHLYCGLLSKWKHVVLVCALEPLCQSHHLGVKTPFAYQRALLEMHESQISGPRWLMAGVVAENPWILFLKKQ